MVTAFDGSESDRLVPIIDIDGEQVGSVTLFAGAVGALVITSDADIVPTNEVVSLAVDVTLVGGDGELLTAFDDPIEICFDTDEDEGDVCLGFLNKDGQWECEDLCLESSGDSLCGETDHLTNFALLLDSSAGDGCGSKEAADYVVAYLSIAFVAVAIVVVLIFIVLVEKHIRTRIRLRRKEFRTIERATVALS